MNRRAQLTRSASSSSIVVNGLAKQLHQSFALGHHLVVDAVADRTAHRGGFDDALVDEQVLFDRDVAVETCLQDTMRARGPAIS